METQVRTPQHVFNMPQQLVVPLFQRPYVWNEENQWEPLWGDVTRLADRVLANPTSKHQPHFLGAVVLQQSPNPVGLMQTRTIIDGQQRLTTLQLLLDALHAQLVAVGAVAPAARLESLVTNAEPFCSRPEDRFKVWPTNRDRPPFNAVMGAQPPVDHDNLGHPGTRMVEAHRYFSLQAREWLNGEAGPTADRATALERTVRELLQMVVIDLGADENAQEIFETLNARGAQLTAADLVKNFIFQRLLEADADVEKAYQEHWREFETGFWETEISVGRLRYPRSSIFLNHWLIARTGEEVVAREVFQRFKRYADHEAGVSMPELLAQIHRAATVYRAFITNASLLNGPLDRLALFGYRTGALESEVVKPLVLSLLDPEEEPVPSAQFQKALDVVESWMVRRMLVRATTKSYTQAVAEMVRLLRENGRTRAGDVIEAHLAAQQSDSRYWPDDDEIRAEVVELQAYRRLSRGRLRMVLEAVEDRLRGWVGGASGMAEERAPRGKLAIEHVMPRKWQRYWPLTPGVDEDGRERLIHTLGNLALLTGRLNSSVSNGPWTGPGGKRAGLEGHSVLLLTRALLRRAGDNWTEDAIRARTSELIDHVVDIWPVPEGHRAGVAKERKPFVRKKVQLSDLIAGGVLEPGMTLYARKPKSGGPTATLLADGQVELDGTVYATASRAASGLTGYATNGWWFFLVDQATRRSLRAVRRDYISAMAMDADDDADDGDDDGDDEE